MSSAPVVIVDPVLPTNDVDAFLTRCRAFGRYRLYAEHEQLEVPWGRGLLPRHDAVVNYLLTRAAPGDDPVEVGSRTSYFREEYAYGDRVTLEGADAFRDHERLAEAARSVHRLPVIEPAIVYANLLLPGQELAVHTDVPEFRGLNRKLVPQWLLVVMHHSQLFDAWRLPIATGVAWFGECEGGDFTYWPDGRDGSEARLDAAHNTAAVLDTDTVFHGVATVGNGAESVTNHGARHDARSDRRWHVARLQPREHAADHVPRRRAALLGVVEGVLLRGRRGTGAVARSYRRSRAR